MSQAPQKMTRRRLLISAAALGLTAATGAGQAGQQAIWRGSAFGAEVEIRLDGVASDAAFGHFRAVARVLAQVERAASLFDPASELCRLNRAGTLRHPSTDLAALMEIAGRLNAATGGAFDPTVQPVFAALAAGGEASELPLARVGWSGVEHHDDEIRVMPGMALTFNGLAQGWAADRVASVLRRRGLDRVLIDTGEFAAIGAPEGRTGWPLRVATRSGEPVRAVRLADRALAVSSPLGTVLDREGRVGHILDPRRGPVRSRWDTIAVSAKSAALADGLSTAFCLLDRSAQARALSAFPDARIELAVATEAV